MWYVFLFVFIPFHTTLNSFIMSFANKILSKISILIGIAEDTRRKKNEQNRDLYRQKKRSQTKKKMDITMVQLIKWSNVPTKFSNEANCFYCLT